MAKNNVFIPSLVSGPSTLWLLSGAFWCACGMTKSNNLMKNPPSKKPIAAGNQGMAECLMHRGCNKDQNCSYHPPANPCIVFITFVSVLK